MKATFPPSVSDRLAELQRQRALAQEQLAWLDREIARETGSAPAPATPLTAAPTTARLSASIDFVAKDNAVAREADDIIAQYKQQNPADAAKDAKQGCYMWFAFVMMTVVLCGAGIYFFYR